jgi:hypothetical protein
VIQHFLVAGHDTQAHAAVEILCLQTVGGVATNVLEACVVELAV